MRSAWHEETPVPISTRSVIWLIYTPNDMTLILSTREFVIKNYLLQFDMLKIRASRLEWERDKAPFCEDKLKNLTI